MNTIFQYWVVLLLIALCSVSGFMIPSLSSVGKLRSNLVMMPIGVPRVPYKIPGSRAPGDWVDIYQRLNRERIIFLGSEIDDESANQLIGVLLVMLTLTATFFI